jgi:hypothetical protein
MHRPHLTTPTRAAGALLCTIAGGMRKRAFVVLKPNQIARVEITAARLASEKMFGLRNALPIGALAQDRPAWSRFGDWHDCRHQHLPKKIRPRNFSRCRVRRVAGTPVRRRLLGSSKVKQGAWPHVGSKTEVSGLARQVRCTLRSRHRQLAPACPFGAKSDRRSICGH